MSNKGTIETLTGMFVRVMVNQDGSEHRYTGTLLMLDDSGLIIREYSRGKSKIVFFPRDILLRIEQDD